MRIVFMGSGPLSCRSLEALCSCQGHTLVGAVTPPDKPKGRELKTSSCEARALAESRGIPVLSPSNVNDPASVAAVRALRPDLVVVVAYGQILKRELLELPPRGCINVHPSLLPKYRGAAPIQWAIANGDRVTGVTLMYLSQRMDAGDIILQESMAIQDDDTGGTLHDKLAGLGGELLVKTVDLIAAGRVTRTPQVESEATYVPKLTKEDGRIDWTKPALEIHNRVRAFSPWPGSFCTVAGKGTLRVMKARVESPEEAAGEVLEASGDGPLVATGSGSLRLLQVQPEGRKSMTGSAYLNGHALKKGDHLL